MTTRWYGKAGIVLALYAAALIGACGVVVLHAMTIPAADMQASGGMYAFGDSILFLGTAGFLALFPTSLAFYWLRPVEWFWRIASIAGLLAAITGPATVALEIVISRFHLEQPNWGLAQFLGWHRIAGAPLLAAGFFICALITPMWWARRAPLTSAAIECVVSVYGGVKLIELLGHARAL